VGLLFFLTFSALSPILSRAGGVPSFDTSLPMSPLGAKLLLF
jgi:hypothetical protein